jgi:hypothetical protein
MVGLLLLKQLENLSDERVVLQFKRNPYYQFFCGYSNYMPVRPCNGKRFDWVDIGLDLVNIFLSKTTKK